MLVVAAVVMVDDRAAGRPPRLSAQVAMAVGVAASIAANVLAAPPDTISRVISAWPAVALMLTVEMLSGRFSRTTAAAKPADIPVDKTPATIADTRWPDIHYSAATLTDILPVTPVVTRTAMRTATAQTRRRTSERSSTAARAAEALANQPDMTTKELAKVIGRAPRTAQRHMPATVNGHQLTVSKTGAARADAVGTA